MRYFFNVCDGHAAVEDQDGTDHPDQAGARQGAIEAARGFLSDGDAKGECRRHWHFDVLDERRLYVMRLPFSHALKTGILEFADGPC